MEQKDVRLWIQHGPSPELIDSAKKFGEQLKRDNLTTSQIRQVFSKIKSIEAKGYKDKRNDFMMIKPLIAYAAGRQNKVRGLQDLKDRLTWGIDAVFEIQGKDERGSLKDEQKRFKNFCGFLEAILAYHRAIGGK